MLTLNTKKKSISCYLIVIALLVVSFEGFSQYGSNDTTFNTFDDGSLGIGTGFDYYVNTIAVKPNGKIICGGQFGSYNNNSAGRIIGLNPNGVIDTSFISGLGFNGRVLTVSIQQDGKIVVGGQYTSYNGTLSNRITRLNGDGSYDSTFNIGIGFSHVNSQIHATAIQPDGKIFAGGYMLTYNGVPVNGIIRINPDGTLDPTFNSETGGGTVQTMSIQSDGKIIVGGAISNGLFRLNVDGSLDTTFIVGSGFSGGIKSTVIQPDGKIIVGGQFTNYNGTEIYKIARLNIDGTLDTSFNPNSVFTNLVYGSINSLALQSDGKIVVGGNFTFVNNSLSWFIRLNTDGTLDNNFNIGTSADYTVRNVCIQPNGKIILGGEFRNFNNVINNYIARINIDGSLDSTFNLPSGANSWVGTILTQADGKIIIGGDFTSFNGFFRKRIARLNPNGSLDYSFNPGDGFNGYIRTIKLQIDGKIIVVGDFSKYDGITTSEIIRLNPDGSRDYSFNPEIGLSCQVNSACLQPDGKIIIGIDSSTYENSLGRGIARLNTDGTIDHSFNLSQMYASWVYRLEIQQDGKIIAGGDNITIGGTTPRLVRLNSDGSIDQSFNIGTGFNATIYSTAIQSDGKIIVIGYFTTFNGTSVNHLARLNLDGSLDASFVQNSGLNSIRCIDIQSDGKILIGGSTNPNNFQLPYLVRLNSDGSLDNTFNTGSGFYLGPGYFTGNIAALCVQTDGNILVGGSFTSYNGFNRNRIARLLAGCQVPAQPNLSCWQTANYNYSNCQWEVTGSPYVEQNITLCSGQLLQVGSNSYNSSGIYMDTLSGVNGCDSIVRTMLTVFPISESTQNINLCYGQTLTVGFNTYNSSGNYIDTLINVNGCDSIVTTNLIIQPLISVNQSMLLCAGEIYTVGNSTYSETGSFTDVLTNSSGCPYTLTTNLIVLDPLQSTQNVTICNGEIFYSILGSPYSSTGVYEEVISSVNGCDSTITTNLTVLQPINVTTTVNNTTITVNETNATFFWLNCENNEILLETSNPSFTVPSNGQYAVIVTKNNCSAMSECITVDNVSLENIIKTSIEVYPNPTSSTLSISGINSEFSYQITDLQGKTLKQGANEKQIEIEQLPSGTYVIGISTDNEVKQLRFVKL
ncbi:MAG: hypothetical protein RL264_350 [Bacteroidota bacterium]|jgi:uncharacterized delta-60 repeat protein